MFCGTKCSFHYDLFEKKYDSFDTGLIIILPKYTISNMNVPVISANKRSKVTSQKRHHHITIKWHQLHFILNSTYKQTQ